LSGSLKFVDDFIEFFTLVVVHNFGFTLAIIWQWRMILL